MNLQKTIFNINKSKESFFNIKKEVWVNFDLFKKEGKFTFYLDNNKTKPVIWKRGFEFNNCLEYTDDLLSGITYYYMRIKRESNFIYIHNNEIDKKFMEDCGFDGFLVLGR